MKKKILILGSTGLIGHQIYIYINKLDKYELFNISKTKLNNETIIIDVLDYSKLENEISKIQPNFIINCIGILIEGCEKFPDKAVRLNSELPLKLERTAKKMNSKLIHMSTDCVFSGLRGNYNEDDHKDGLSVYAKTKIAGETLSDHNLIIRTSVIGPELKEGSELFDWFMRQEESINGYTGSIWSGVTTLELAKMVVYCIEKNISGLYNFASPVSISKYDLLTLIKEIFRKTIKINKVVGVKTNKVLIDNRKLINFDIPSYINMLKQLYLEMDNNSTYYARYNKYFSNNNEL